MLLRSERLQKKSTYLPASKVASPSCSPASTLLSIRYRRLCLQVKVYFEGSFRIAIISRIQLGHLRKILPIHRQVHFKESICIAIISRMQLGHFLAQWRSIFFCAVFTVFYWFPPLFCPLSGPVPRLSRSNFIQFHSTSRGHALLRE